MANVGMRIIYDQDGEIVTILGEMAGDVSPRKKDVILRYVDVEYGTVNFENTKITSVDVLTKKLNLEETRVYESPERVRIKELEALLAAQTNGE